jgi:hypothetical protein
MIPVYVYITQILLFKSKWDTLSVLNIENEKYFVSKNRAAAPFNIRNTTDVLQVYSLRWLRLYRVEL